MGFFRRAPKTKKKPLEIHEFDHEEEILHNQIIVVVPSRRISSFRSENQRMLPREDDDSSVGEALAPEDQFYLHVPIKQKKTKSILRSGRGRRRSYSSQQHNRDLEESSTASSITIHPSDFVEENTQSKNQTISMRSIKSRQNSIKPNGEDQEDHERRLHPLALSKGEAVVTSEMPNDSEWCCVPEQGKKRIDIDERVPKQTYHGTTKTYKGVKATPRNRDMQSLMNSTIPTFPTEEKRDPPPVTPEETTNACLMTGMCGPTQVSNVLVDDYTTNFKYPRSGGGGTSNKSLFDPYADDDEGRAANYTTKTMINKFDNKQTPHADIGMENSTTPLEVFKDVYLDDCDSTDGTRNWKFRLPKNLPKVHTINRMSSLAKVLSFRSTRSINRSIRSKGSRGSKSRGRSKDVDSRSRWRSKSPQKHHRRRSPSQGRSSTLNRTNSSSRSTRRSSKGSTKYTKIDPTTLYADRSPNKKSHRYQDHQWKQSTIKTRD
jgi:hypothetical protein